MTMSDDDLQKALRFLKSTPSQRIKTLANKAAHDAALLILRARYLGLCSAKALFFVDRIYVVGAGYREAAERGARHAYNETLRPTLEELLPAPRRREPGWDW
ncbi:hypothetical protein [Bosea sp. ANAM02]|uniref:hypothetical protein n=1 Tax=Bosea sp. ANAM02 TaxID=2020412 RepID=UPI001565ABAC|nr:hypothetical protein [Bosea sp. ANAM02]